MWFVSREEVVCPHYAGQPFKGPGASLCLGSQASECQSLASSQGPARAAAGRAGTHRKRKACCLSGSSATFLRSTWESPQQHLPGRGIWVMVCCKYSTAIILSKPRGFGFDFYPLMLYPRRCPNLKPWQSGHISAELRDRRLGS